MASGPAASLAVLPADLSNDDYRALQLLFGKTERILNSVSTRKVALFARFQGPVPVIPGERDLPERTVRARAARSASERAGS